MSNVEHGISNDEVLGLDTILANKKTGESLRTHLSLAGRLSLPITNITDYGDKYPVHYFPE
jgi:hypothetical protein